MIFSILMTEKAMSPIKNFLNELLESKSIAGQVIRRFRRFYYIAFKKEYVLKNIAENRQGECHRCGKCCELIYRCPFLGKDAENLPYCRIYGELRPGNCRYYPFDKTDSEVEQCGFKFKK